MCDNPCQNNWANGACGHNSAKDGHYYANLYTKVCHITRDLHT